jgi:hypothetical protein
MPVDMPWVQVLMQQRKPICYHSETFSQVVVNYPTYDKELYALVQSVKKWKHYLMARRLSYIQIISPCSISVTNQASTSSSLQVDGIPSTVSFGNKIQEGTSNKVADMLSRPPISASIVLKNASLSHDSYVEQYANDE